MKRLGRGLGDLIETAAPPQQTAAAGVANNFVMLRTAQVRMSKLQPRKSHNDSSFEELKSSIQKSGVIEPVIVRPLVHGTYELVAGERRFRAAQALGMAEVPAIIKTLSDKEALEFSLVENVQRENLNPVEEAGGYARLQDEFGYTQEDIAKAVGKDRTTVTNLLRVLALPEEIRQGLLDGAITMGHAKALLSLEDRERQAALFRRIKQEHLSVRQAEGLIGALAPARRRRLRREDPQLKSLEDQLRSALGTKVTLSARKKGGRIIIEYFSPEDLTRILQLLGAAS